MNDGTNIRITKSIYQIYLRIKLLKVLRYCNLQIITIFAHMETTFDKVPIKAGKKRGAKPKYRFDLMQKDDSFFAPNITKSGLVSAAFNWAKRNNSKFKFVVREDEKDGVNGMRIWRVK